MATEPTPRRSEDELLALVRRKAAAIHNRRRIAALGAGTLVLFLIAGGVAIAGNGGGAGKRTIHVAGESPTSAAEDTTTSTEAAATTTAVAQTTTTAAPRPAKATTTTTAPPAGLNVTIEAEPASGPIGMEVHFKIHVTDGDGTITDFLFDYGDGTAGSGYGVRDSCVAQPSGGGPTPPSPRPLSPTNKTEEYVHRYQAAGTFTATVDVTTGGGCGAIPPERRTATATFTAVAPQVSQEPTTTTTAP